MYDLTYLSEEAARELDALLRQAINDGNTDAVMIAVDGKPLKGFTKQSGSAASTVAESAARLWSDTQDVIVRWYKELPLLHQVCCKTDAGYVTIISLGDKSLLIVLSKHTNEPDSLWPRLPPDLAPIISRS
jgi:hypothetical protein